ncbi:MAG: regulatory signaling modulator protein AmpE [Pseudomonadota bacterium]
MDFITLIIALSLYQVVRPGSWLQHDKWLNSLDERLREFLHNRFVSAVALLLLLMIALSWALAELEGWWFGLVPIAFAVGMLLWSLGHDDYHTELERQLAVETAEAIATSQESIKLWMPRENTFATEVAADSEEHASTRRLVLYSGYARWFPPVLYFLLFGPAFAVAYRAVALLAAKETATSEVIYNNILFYLDWLPARAVAATFALAGNFTAVTRTDFSGLLLSAKGAPSILETVANASLDQVDLKAQSELLYRCSGLWLLGILLLFVLS